MNRLLKGAQPLPSDNVYRNFVKPGGWDRALKDFQTAMRDTDIQTSQMPKKVCFNSYTVMDQKYFNKVNFSIDFSVFPCSVENTLKCLSIGTPKNNEFSICPKWKIHYFQMSQNLGRVQPHYNMFEYWDT